MRGIDSRYQFLSKMHGSLIIDQLWSIKGTCVGNFCNYIYILHGHAIHVCRGILMQEIDSRNQFLSKMYGSLRIDQLWPIKGIRETN